MSSNFELRTNFIRYVFTLVAAVFLVQIIHLMIIGPSEYWEDISRGHEEEILPTRGIIYDRNGNPLATNYTLYTLSISPDQVWAMDNSEDIVEALARILNGTENPDYIKFLEDSNEIAKGKPLYTYENLRNLTLVTEEQAYLKYREIADYVDKEQIDQIALTMEEYEKIEGTKRNPAPSLYGVHWAPFLVRRYPEGDLASNILGKMTIGDEVYYGVEKEYDDLLSGAPTTTLATNRPNVVDESKWPEGASLVLTIDREIQRTMEDILDNHMKKTDALSGTIIVLDPETGDVLAMATDVEKKLRITTTNDDDPRIAYPNPAVEAVYEPGSVAKVLTMAGAIDAGVVTPDSPFLDMGSYTIGSITVSNWDRNAYGSVTMTECMQYSLNVCLAYVADQMGYETFYSYMEAFNVGHFSGIDLDGEQIAPLNAATDLSNMAANAFGQGMNVAPIQMASAISAVANDGVMMTPRVVRSVISDGKQYDLPTKVLGKPISAETAHTITDMLAESLQEEADVYVQGYRMSGKTGTAEIWPHKGHPAFEQNTYRSDDYNASFVGWGPVDDPQFLVYIWLEEPQGEYWGSLVAAPVFSDVAKELVVLMDIPPDDVRIQLADDPTRLKHSVNTE